MSTLLNNSSIGEATKGPTSNDALVVLISIEEGNKRARSTSPELLLLPHK
jgi:hypothetical protein